MKRVLVTGMSGTGKSTLLAELASRGFWSVDTDYGDYLETVDGEVVWVNDRIDALRDAATLEVVTTLPVGVVADIVLAHVG